MISYESQERRPTPDPRESIGWICPLAAVGKHEPTPEYLQWKGPERSSRGSGDDACVRRDDTEPRTVVSLSEYAAARHLACVLWDAFTYEEVSTVEALAEKWTQVLRRHRTLIYVTGAYESPKGREEERVAAVRDFIDRSSEDILIPSVEDSRPSILRDSRWACRSTDGSHRLG